MKRELRIFIIFVLGLAFALGISFSKVYAFTSDDALHPVAHGAGSYALTHIGEVTCRKLTNFGKLSCSLISGAIATGVGIAVESTQSESAKDHARSYVENATGVILAIGVINLDF